MKWSITLLLLLPLFTAFVIGQDIDVENLWRNYEQEGDVKKKIQILIDISEASHELNTTKSIETTYLALDLATEINDLDLIFNCYNNLGIYFDNLGKTDSTYFYYDKALAAAIQLDDPYYIAIAKNNLGTYYLFKGNFSIALQYLLEAVADHFTPGEELNHVITYSNIGVIYEEFGNWELAREYYEKSARAALEQDEASETAFAKLCYGYIAQIEENYEEAIRQYDEALTIYRELKMFRRIAETLYYLGFTYMEQGQFEVALARQQDALAIYARQQSVNDLPSMYAVIGQIHERAGNQEQADFYYGEAIALAKEVDSPIDLVWIYEDLAESYAKKKDYEKAYQYQRLFREMSDTIYGRETRERMDQLKTTYDLKMQMAENAKLKAEQEKNRAELKQRTTFATAASLIALLIAGIAILYYRAHNEKKTLAKNLEKEVVARTADLQRANTKLLNSNEELERFTYIASHDLKEPLRNITSFINLIQRKFKDTSDQDLHDYMGFVTANTKQMHELLNDILAFSRITDVDDYKFELIDLRQLIDDVRNGLSMLLQEKNGVIKAGDLPEIEGSRVQFFLLFKNLIENGLKYNQSQQAIVEINYSIMDRFYQFEVRDNGIGIDPKYHNQIFEMFKRLHNRTTYRGTGIGLATCKKIVTALGGEIWVKSKEGEGCRVFFTFPKSLSKNTTAPKAIEVSA